MDSVERPGERSLISGGETLESAGITVDELFSVLSNRRRRDVLRYLKQVEGEVKVRDLCEQIAAWENDTTREELDYEERKRVYTSLHQNHLPRMEDKGFIEYGQRRDEVRLTDAIRNLTVRLTTDGRPFAGVRPDARTVAYLGSAFVALAGTLGVLAGVPAFDPVTPTGVLGVVTVLLLAIAAAHVVSLLR